MKLSEAIVLSIGVVRNDSTLYFSPDGWLNGPGPCGCAIGTALYSVGVRSWVDLKSGRPDDWTHEIYYRWPWTVHDKIAAALSHRHTRGESREALAAWIATLEPVEDDMVGVCVTPPVEEVSCEPARLPA